MSRGHLLTNALWGVVVLIVAFQVGCGQGSPYTDETGPVSAAVPVPEPTRFVQGRVTEVETERLICAVIKGTGAGQSFQTTYAISCVPKIPGLFEEGDEQR